MNFKYLISHRGNLTGALPDEENRPSYIMNALENGFECQVDVWSKNDKFYLGHDEPQYETNELFLESKGLWCRAKNVDALEKMIVNKSIHCFFHDKDDVTLTSRNILWTYPNKQLTNKSICVSPEKVYGGIKTGSCLGICSDFVLLYKNE